MRCSRSASSLPFRSAMPNPRSPGPEGPHNISTLDNLATIDYFLATLDVRSWLESESMMHWFALGIALLVALAIIAIGILYLASPLTATRSFGLPLPEYGANLAWWLRLKGVRDIVSGL